MNSKQGRFQAAAANGDNTLSLQAYLTDRKTDVVVRANAVEREWISTETGGNGYRCIPLNMASSLGWSFLTPFTLAVIYDGKRLAISAKDKRIDATRLVTDQFGAGIFTFYVAVVFRTPPGHNLLVTGPMNEPRRGATPRNGFVDKTGRGEFHDELEDHRAQLSGGFPSWRPLLHVFPLSQKICRRVRTAVLRTGRHAGCPSTI